MIIHWIKVVLALFTSVTYSQGSFIHRFRSNLVLFGGDTLYNGDQRSVLYTNSNKDDWKNLTKLAHDGGLNTKGLLCGVGNGAWLAYPEENYKYEKNGQDYVLLIIGDACVPAENLNSAQAIGPINKDFEGLATFKESNFASEAENIVNGSSASGVKSLIYAGEQHDGWTVEGGGKKFCVYRPETLLSPGICILPDIETQLKISGTSISWGCDEGKLPKSLVEGINFQLQTCFTHHGVHKITDNFLQLPVISSVCSGSPDPATKLGFLKIVDAWKFRMNPDRQEELNPAEIDKNKDDDRTPMRMKLITYFFGIFKEGCPTVPAKYFNLVRYLFMQHIKTVWDQAPQVLDKNDTTSDWYTSFVVLQNCFNRIAAHEIQPPPEEVACEYSNPQTGPAPEWESSVLDLLLSGDILDQIIEQVWTMLNFVSPYCSSLNTFGDNFWTDFVNFFRRQFLLPVLQQWVSPGTWQTYYAYMFNGFPIEKGKRLIIACVQNLLRTAPPRVPVDRPSSMITQFVQLSKYRPPVTTLRPRPPGRPRPQMIKE